MLIEDNVPFNVLFLILAWHYALFITWLGDDYLCEGGRKSDYGSAQDLATSLAFLLAIGIIVDVK